MIYIWWNLSFFLPHWNCPFFPHKTPSDWAGWATCTGRGLLLLQADLGEARSRCPPPAARRSVFFRSHGAVTLGCDLSCQTSPNKTGRRGNQLALWWWFSVARCTTYLEVGAIMRNRIKNQLYDYNYCTVAPSWLNMPLNMCLSWSPKSKNINQFLGYLTAHLTFIWYWGQQALIFLEVTELSNLRILELRSHLFWSFTHSIQTSNSGWPINNQSSVRPRSCLVTPGVQRTAPLEKEQTTGAQNGTHIKLNSKLKMKNAHKHRKQQTMRHLDIFQ